MKHTLSKTFFCALILFLPITSLWAQKVVVKNIDTLTYAKAHDLSFYKNVRNNALIDVYITANGNKIHVGDTLTLGTPTSEEMNTRTYESSYGEKKIRGAIGDSRSTSTKTYAYIRLGRPGGIGNILMGAAGEADLMANETFKRTVVLVTEIKAFHRGSSNKPLNVLLTLGEINGRAFGMNKNLTVTDTELALEYKEILLQHTKLTRDEAIAKLKEAKELMEIEMMTREEFDQLKKQLAPIIQNKN